MIIRNNSSFLVKRKNAPTLTKEPNNLKGKNSFRFNGLIRRKTVSVEPAAKGGKGVVLSLRNGGSVRKPATNYTRIEMKNNARKTLKKIGKILHNGGYRADLKMCAVRRASALLSSQKPVPVKKARGGKKKA